jgi:hypothetical protein
LGESVPLWASLTRIFWLGFIYVFGVIIGIRNLFRIRRMDTAEIVENGGLWGVLIFSGIILLGFVGGGQLSRLLMYTPLFTIPLIMRFLAGFDTPVPIKATSGNYYLVRPWNWLRKYSFVVTSIIFLVLSFPTFLVNYATVNTTAIYQYEHSTGEFIESSYGDGRSLLFISDVPTTFSYVYYIPNAEIYSPSKPAGMSEEDLWITLDWLMDKFENSSKSAVFAFTEKFDWAYRNIMLIDQNDQQLLELIDRLSQQNKIYDNGHTQIYPNTRLSRSK